jgi:glycosyltransferase involved in cell wall biosynthesis
MTVSIIICTRNRADSLRATLASIAQATVPAEWSVELLVVDNGSTAEMHAAVGTADTSQMPVMCVLETCFGKSLPYNTVIPAAAAEVLLWKDDVVMASPDWLQILTSRLGLGQYARGRTDFTGTGFYHSRLAVAGRINQVFNYLKHILSSTRINPCLA